MKRILTAIALLAATASYGQLKGALKGAKEKVNEKVNEIPSTPSVPVSSGSSSSSSTTPAKKNLSPNGEPAYSENDPIYRAYSGARDNINNATSYLKDNWLPAVQNSNSFVSRTLEAAQQKLEILRNDPVESKKPYMDTLTAKWNKAENLRAEKYGVFLKNEAYHALLVKYDFFTSKIQQGDYSENEDTTFDASYKGYNNLRSELMRERPSWFEGKGDFYINNIDRFFKTDVYKVIPHINKKVDEISKEMHAKGSYGDDFYMLNAASILPSMEAPRSKIEFCKTYLMEDHSAIDTVLAKLDKEKAILDEHISSGKYKAYREKYQQDVINAVRLGKKEMSNPTYEAMAIAGVDKGKCTRAIIISDMWLVKKNEYGIILHKYLPVNMAVTLDGKCYLAYGNLRQTYEGGGRYGKVFFEYYGIRDEMNCANTTK